MSMASEFRRRDMARLKKKEEVGQVAWLWADKMAEAIMQKPVGSPKGILSGTLHCAGGLAEVVSLLYKVSLEPCKCEEMARMDNAHDEDWEWDNADYHHYCLSYAARSVIKDLAAGIDFYETRKT